MKQILFLSTVSMVTAGIFGLADMTNDVFSGTMIEYEKQDPPPVAAVVPAKTELKMVKIEKGNPYANGATKRTHTEVLNLVKINPVVDPSLYSRFSFTTYHPFTLNLFEQPSGFYKILYPKANSFTLDLLKSESQTNPFAFTGKDQGNFNLQENENVSGPSPECILPFDISAALKPEEEQVSVFLNKA